MRVLEINSVCGIRSTGRICTDLADVLIENGHECRIAYARETAPEKYQNLVYRIGIPVDYQLHVLESRLFGNTAFYSGNATKTLLKKLDAYRPDLIHLHNLHGYYLHIGLLFKYIKEKKIPVVWTLHDCWAFTGHCVHFTAQQCDKWKTGCQSCSWTSQYPKCIWRYDTQRYFERKKTTFLGVDKLTLVTPSQWLADLTRESFLKGYPVKVINNGIDLQSFRPTESAFKRDYGIEDKCVIMGAATSWSKRKGLEDFLSLSNMIDDRYRIVLVGLSEKQTQGFPDNVIAIPITNDLKKLAEIYTAADVFANLSYQETMGLVTVEAAACGTPAVVYNQTAVPEMVDDSCGIVVPAGDIAAVEAAIRQIDQNRLFSSESCIAHAQRYEKRKQYEEYLRVYETMWEKT